MPNSHPFLSRAVRQFAREIYGDRTPVTVPALAAYMTCLYHGFATGADWERLATRGFNAYMILAMCREMSQGE